MNKPKNKFVCQTCGYETAKWMGKCPACGAWNTLEAQLAAPSIALSAHGPYEHTASAMPQAITEVPHEEGCRMDARLGELNRVLGGGLVEGSLTLLGGDPGIGKSTLLLQLSQNISKSGRDVLYVSAEESLRQTRLRASRLGTLSDTLYVLAENDMTRIVQLARQTHPSLMVVDSIQTVYDPNLTSAPGSVAQVRECTNLLMQLAKNGGIAIIIVGHVTKQGELAGPRLLEHMVDTVLYFEGERHSSYRILRAVKNRFGSTHEMGVFEMAEQGLVEVGNPSELFLTGRVPGVSGSTVVVSLEGTRPVLVELQALVTPTTFATPRRMATGVDYNRVALLMAVLEKRVGLFLQNQDAYVNVAGGVKLNEPAMDLGIVVALASSFRDMATQPADVVIGEVGLTGEVRGVPHLEQRLYEARKMGFLRAIVPQINRQKITAPSGLKVIGVQTVQEALQEMLGG